ncbi:hypothetical protein Tco_0099681, partial [Tanacetum coccineum]
SPYSGKKSLVGHRGKKADVAGKNVGTCLPCTPKNMRLCTPKNMLALHSKEHACLAKNMLPCPPRNKDYI